MCRARATGNQQRGGHRSERASRPDQHPVTDAQQQPHQGRLAARRHESPAVSRSRERSGVGPQADRPVNGTQHLYLSGNHVVDLSPLKGLTRLSSLHLDGNQITDLRPIGGLKPLSSLDLENNKITDLSALAGLNSLQHLFLEGNPVSDLTPLITMARKDAEGEKRFAPFCMVYLSPHQGKAGQVAELSKYVHTVEVSAAKPEGHKGGKKK